MPAEVVVIVEDQYFRIASGLLPVQECGGKAGDSAADDDQVIDVIAKGFGSREPGAAPCDRVRHFEGAGMTAAKAGEPWRVPHVATAGGEQIEWRQAAAGHRAERDAVQEITAGDIKPV